MIQVTRWYLTKATFLFLLPLGAYDAVICEMLRCDSDKCEHGPRRSSANLFKSCAIIDLGAYRQISNQPHLAPQLHDPQAAYVNGDGTEVTCANNHSHPLDALAGIPAFPTSNTFTALKRYSESSCMFLPSNAAKQTPTSIRHYHIAQWDLSLACVVRWHHAAVDNLFPVYHPQLLAGWERIMTFHVVFVSRNVSSC